MRPPPPSTPSTTTTTTTLLRGVRACNSHARRLVQAEAPPGALFKRFKAQLRTNPDLSQSDIAFFFVHWLTDLAGAEPTPLSGSEKLVVKFPHPVLHSFIASFDWLTHLAVQSETEVFDSYLQSRWRQLPSSWHLPDGPEGIALQRLLIHVQLLPYQQAIIHAWPKLDDDARAVLSFEMSLTGAGGQRYARVPERSQALYAVGPAFLVYYGPEFLRTASRTNALAGLHMLAEIYRQARSIWPARGASVDENVTIRIDQIRQLPPENIRTTHAFGEAWMLVRKNPLEGIVEKVPLYSIVDRSDLDRPNSDGSSSWTVEQIRLLAFWWGIEDEDDEEDDEPDAFIVELENVRRERMHPAILQA